jgi:starvation-inducible outer membrane lipoprotein
MFRPYLHKIMGLICISLVFSLIGCVTLATDHRKEGFDTIQKGFASLDETPNLHEVIKVGGVTVHIVGSRNQFDWNIAAAYGSPVVGYANTKNEIWVFGKVVKGKIIVNQAILGHELTHLLNFNNPKIANPDLLDELGV